MANQYQHSSVTENFKLLIVEDEPVISDRLKRLFSDIFKSREMLIDVDTASSLQDARRLLEDNDYQLLSLDLNLHGDSGFTLLQQACCCASQCIIISAYRDQALTAFEYGVLDFIAKPFSRQRLEKAINRLLQNDRDTLPHHTKYLMVKNGGDLLRLLIDDIESISGYGNYSLLHLQNGQEHLHEKGLDSLLKLLPDHFVRIHKSHIFNLDKFRELNSLGGGQYQLKTLSGKVIPVGRSKVQYVKTRLE